LLKELAATGTTVFVSSHLLSEVEQICDHLVMIRAGRLLFQGHVAELLAAGGPRILVCPEHRSDIARLTSLLRAAGLRADVVSRADVVPRRGAAEVVAVGGGSTTDRDDRCVSVHAPEDAAADLNRLAARADITLCGLHPYRPTLEETFLEATGMTDGDITVGDSPRRGASGAGCTDSLVPGNRS
jgi:ABC-2 type transport system ATP-binding protein